MIKWEHTVFALPFAYAGMLAAPVAFSLSDLVWITVAMFGARTAGMTLNRIIDAGMDARNPRTADRAIPKGLVGVKEGLGFNRRGDSPAGPREPFFLAHDNPRSLAARRSWVRGPTLTPNVSPGSVI
jgi:hypothetical protein